MQLYRRKKFDKELRLMQKRGKKLSKLWDVVELILAGEPLSQKFRNHKLVGNYEGFWECHIEPDWLLVYEISKDAVYLARTGTHSDLFK